MYTAVNEFLWNIMRNKWKRAPHTDFSTEMWNQNREKVKRNEFRSRWWWWWLIHFSKKSTKVQKNIYTYTLHTRKRKRTPSYKIAQNICYGFKASSPFEWFSLICIRLFIRFQLAINLLLIKWFYYLWRMTGKKWIKKNWIWVRCTALFCSIVLSVMASVMTTLELFWLYSYQNRAEQ